ncbi:flavin-containing monooxygenase [Allokutzneria albata]|uniref:Dimethylaniline monooxygenase (N-oxide forming) n=1 Tax=Allokutzneria albata TaxID=211114 RepID=A0A1G9R0T1_ALLAB|nr:FAD-dependent oxidoreductase [Allokutzneria albata]SDM16902.1 dimethylaniline monooxygenase (N-oxide forming) [Allokutzneria albata]
MRRYAVIGAGPGGLVAAKELLALGAEPVVFERAGEIGGVWRAGGLAWPGMSTNLSKHSCCFSDFPWPHDAPDFPCRDDMRTYLHRYAEHFGLTPHLRLREAVTTVRGTIVNGEPFDGVIFASGAFGPTGTEYRGAERYRGKRVVVVGAAFSGAEIAAELAAAGIEVTAVASRPMWLLPRYLDGVPWDLVSYRRDRPRPSYAEANRRFARIAVNPGEFDERMRLDPDSDRPPYLVISDLVPAMLRAGALRLEPGRAVRREPGAVVLDTGVRLPCDEVIDCTGHRLGLPYLSPDQRAVLGHDPADLLQPLLLHECTFHPEFLDAAFVGLYRGPYFGVMELQARWAAAVLTGALPRPSGMRAGLERQLEIREQRPRPQFPHGDYVGMADRLAAEIGVLPDPPPDGPLLPAHYRLHGPGRAPDLARAEIAFVARRTAGSQL